MYSALSLPVIDEHADSIFQEEFDFQYLQTIKLKKKNGLQKFQLNVNVEQSIIKTLKLMITETYDDRIHA